MPRAGSPTAATSPWPNHRANRCIAIEAASGRELWRLGTQDLLPTNPVVADGVVFVAGYNFDSEDGTLYAVWGESEPEPVASPAATPADSRPIRRWPGAGSV